MDVAVVECATFDELAAALTKAIDLPQPLYDYAMVGRPAPRLVPVQPPSAEARRFPVLRYSALLIEAMPLVARRVRLTQATTSPEVRGLFKSAGVRATAAAMGRELAVFGRDQDILNALAQLGATLAGTIELDPARESWAAGLVYDTLVRALARRRPLIPRLRRSGHSIIVAPPRADERPDQTARRESSLRALKDAYGTTLTGTVPKLMFPFQEGISLKLDQIDGRWWCGFEPYTFVELPMRERPPAGSEDRSSSEDEYDPLSGRNDRGGDPAGDWRRERWAQRYNSTWARIIGAWLIKSGMDRPPTKASGFPVPRGTMVIRSGNSALVWVAGNAPDVSTKGDYYQGKKSIPRPLQLIRHAGSGPLELTAHEALALTKMDWNNDALYDPVPVSIRYSQRLARTIANVPDLPRSVYPYRLFM